MINKLVCFTEEDSMKAMLEGLLPRFLPIGITFQCISSSGKQDLERKLQRKLQNWNHPNTAFLIILDQDSNDCKLLKNKIYGICLKAGKPQALVRIACHELESYYFGDLNAVECALGIKGLVDQARKAKFRVPDNIENPAYELEQITNGVYQKVTGSWKIGKYLSLSHNSSKSFNALLSGINKLLGII